jgi:hypothetical protein
MAVADPKSVKPRRSSIRVLLWMAVATVAGILAAFEFILVPAIKRARDSGIQYGRPISRFNVAVM